MPNLATKRLREFPELQSGELPRTIRDYFMGIEPLSVYKLSESISALAGNVASMSREVESLSKDMRNFSKWMWGVMIPLALAVFAAVIKFIFGG